ncbi:MAG: ABC transporter ATP-binding protein [Verrucomicrobiae bacterium]|nr:ABC transporter ATP-binding protein [Verrucomicrobiae bacterium]
MSQSTSNEPVIVVEHLTKVFRDFWRRPKVRAVRDVSFEVHAGEVFGLLGPNGAGKSTTLKILLGLLHPTQGTVRVLGRSPRDVKTKQRIGYVPEESYLYPFLTSEETLEFYGTLFDLDRVERRRRIEQLLDMIGLRHARRRPVGEFSKGMARRIGIAQALINDPELVLLDEPTSGLDPLGCREVKDLIRALAQRGKTIVLSSHLLADVEDVCDRILILYNGQVQAQGTIHELLEERGRYRVTLPADCPPTMLQRILELVRAELGREPDVDHPRRNLEQFFLEVVERARRETAEASGVGPTRGVAEYLAPPRPRLEQLATTSSPSPAPPEPAETPPDEADRQAADEKLKRLVQDR